MKKMFIVLSLLIPFVAKASDKKENVRKPNQVTGNFLNVEPGERKSDKTITVSPSQVNKVIELVNKPIGQNHVNLQVKVIVVSSGGSADMSPRNNVYFGLYSENEMSDSISTYDIGPVFKLTSARRVSGGIYELLGQFTAEDVAKKRDSKITINAVAAIKELETLRCDEGSVCELKSSIKILK